MMVSQMRNENRFFPAIALVAVMMFSTLAGAATVTTFSTGNDSVVIEIRDSTTYSNDIDGIIVLPDDETVTSATMKVSTKMVVHDQHSRIDSNTQYVWDPNYNNQMTNYSNLGDFTYNDESVSLVSNGFTTDFEQTDAGFIAGVPLPGGSWEHGILSGGNIIPSNCNSGLECWGTNAFDNNYTDDQPQQTFSYDMESPAIEVKSTGFIARFASYHSLFYNSTISGPTTNSMYYDCAYIEVLNSSNGQNWGPPVVMPFDMSNSSGIGFGSGLYQKGTGNGKIQSGCDGVAVNEYALGGTSVDTALNPTGWATLAVNLQHHIGRFVKFRFVLERNTHTGNPVNDSMPGWFIDDFRLGSPLPQSGWMDVKNIAPRIQPYPGFPDGYGILLLESETTPTNSLTIDIMEPNTGNVVFDNAGNQMSGLSGSIIELWDINASVYPAINLRFNFDSGVNRLSTPTLHGFSMGSRLGSGFNDTTSIIAMDVQDGVWNSPGMDIPLLYSPMIMSNDYNPPALIQRLEYPITSIKPIVTDSCTETPNVQAVLPNGEQLNLSNNVWTDLPTPSFSFRATLSYSGSCAADGLWFDLEFGFNPSQVQIDIAGDGDIEWGFDEPAFGRFGRQSEFWGGKTNEINYATPTSTVTLGSTGTGQGATFMMPVGADVIAGSFAMDSNTISSLSNASEGFDLVLTSSGQEASLGSFENFTIWLPEASAQYVDFTAAIQSLLDNPMVAVSHTDVYGNDWVSIHFGVSNENASTGSSVRMVDLNVLYDLEQTLAAGHGLVRELNQGVALGVSSGGTVSVPIEVLAASGGGLNLSNLNVITSAGYDSTISLQGNPVGLYPDGTIYEAITTHVVDGGTGSTLQDSTLRLESSSGSVQLSYSDFGGFAETNDPLDLITLQSSSAVDIAGGKEVTWRFVVNTNWEDTPEVRMFAGLVAVNGVEGLPAGLTLAPFGGNAVENDAGIFSLDVQNSAGESQSFTDGRSNQMINLVGSVRLENLDVSPDPSAYFLVVEIEEMNNTIPENITYEWVELANMSGPIGGDFDWAVDLGSEASGSADYRFRMTGYDKGGLICPSSEYNPDADCAIPFHLTIDTFAPNLVNISVFENQIFWRVLLDDTWIQPDQNQLFRVEAQDMPIPPEVLMLNYWVEYDHDANGDSIPQESEYQQITMYCEEHPSPCDTATATEYYEAEINDYANLGRDPTGKVSIFVSGTDLAGNPIDGGVPGFDYDLITYVGMSSQGPELQNLYIYDNEGVRFTDQQRTMYAGNTYNLEVEGRDANGWRDIQYFEIDLNPGVADDMVITYFPRNDTLIVDSDWIHVLEESNESEGVQMLRMDGGRLVDPFESDYKLNIPLQIDWNVPTASGVMTPQVRVKDLDPSNPSTVLTETGGRNKQRWIYSDGILLDFPTSLSLTDNVDPVTENIYDFQLSTSQGFVFLGDEVSFAGQYAFVDGWPDLIVNPETELFLEITRQTATADPVKGYGQQQGETTVHNFYGGQFNITLTMPSTTNEYTYTFQLINLPPGATDATLTEQKSFSIKVDGNPPSVSPNTWSVKDTSGDTLDIGVLPSSTIHCVDITVMVSEREQLDAGAIKVNWNFFQAGNTWSYYVMEFGADNLSSDLVLTGTGDLIIAKANCVDLWPADELPGRTQLDGVKVQFWISGQDSAGLGVSGGGSFGIPILGLEAAQTSQYEVVYEQAEWSISQNDVRMYPNPPAVGQEMELDITLTNTGNTAGNITLDIYSNVGGTRQKEMTITTPIIDVGGKHIESISLEAFTTATTSVHYEIENNETGEILWHGLNAGKQFSVAESVADENEGTLMLILAIVGVLVVVLGVVVVVLVMRNRGEDGDDFYDEYLDEEEVKDFPALQSASQASAGASPEMQQALQEFPQWTEEQIQGYFDQGWSVDALRDWVNES